MISVIIPVYNRTNSFRRCLQSLVNQTFKDFEVIVYDDGSSEDVPSVINEFIDKINIYYYYGVNSGGPSTPRNIAVQKCNYDIIAFLDSDDIWSDDKLNIISRKTILHKDIIHHKVSLVSSDGIVKRSIGFDRSSCLFDFLKRGNPIVTSSVVCRKSFFIECLGFNANLVVGEDFDLWLRMIQRGGKFRYISKTLGQNILGVNNISQDTFGYFLFFQHVRKVFYPFITKKKLGHIDGYFYYLLGSKLLLEGKKYPAKVFFIRSFMLKPFSLNGFLSFFKLITTA